MNFRLILCSFHAAMRRLEMVLKMCALGLSFVDQGMEGECDYEARVRQFDQDDEGDTSQTVGIVLMPLSWFSIRCWSLCNKQQRMKTSRDSSVSFGLRGHCERFARSRVLRYEIVSVYDPWCYNRDQKIDPVRTHTSNKKENPDQSQSSQTCPTIEFHKWSFSRLIPNLSRTEFVSEPNLFQTCLKLVPLSNLFHN